MAPHACGHLRHLFPYLPQQSGYNKRLRKAAELLRRVTRLLAVDTSVRSDDVWIVDSTPVECGRSRETVNRSDLAGWAEYGYCASHSRFLRGLRLHLVCALQGLPVAFTLTGAKADERETLLDPLADEPGLTSARPGQTPIGDKNYVGPHLSKTSLPNWTSDCCGRPARVSRNGPVSRCSNQRNRTSSLSTRPSRANSTSNSQAPSCCVGQYTAVGSGRPALNGDAKWRNAAARLLFPVRR
ncbi:hypothetical protein GCM10009654_14710 [Streptomyces hebeiensis]|uniref:Transposase IS4-like domain-containing protein n=1 Tax=Streptomyces hebeiensis TaxID=229486 RepID=A0ABN1UNX3_9ACTN